MFRVRHLVCTFAYFAALAVSWTGVSFSAQAQSSTAAPDGTPLACPGFHVRLRGEVTAIGWSLDCGPYVISIASGHKEFAIARGGSEKLWYLLEDLPLNGVTLLLNSERQPTPVVARRSGTDRLDFMIGDRLFKEPPKEWQLRPRRKESAEVEPAPDPGMSADPKALIGSWRGTGVILLFNQSGTFQQVSNSAYGSYGGVAGLDYGGSYTVDGDQLSIASPGRGKTTCPFSVGPYTLIFCKIKYQREKR